MGDVGKAKWIWGVGVALWCVVLAGALSANRVLSLSVDSSYHLQVMEVVRHAFLIPEKGHEWMAEMVYYPKLSHRFAGLFATLGWRQLNALTMAGVLSAAVVWACLFAQARRVSLLFLGASAVLTVVNVLVTRGAFGGELIDNFFFPQIVGEGVAMLCLVGGVSLLPRSRPVYVVFAIAAVGFCGCFHLVPTLQLAGALTAMLGVTWLREVLATRRFELVGFAGLIGIPSAIVLNPFFAKMRWMAVNNGSLHLKADLSMEGLALFAALLLTMSVWVLLVELLRPFEADEPETEESNRSALMFASLGAACAAAMLAQYAAFVFLHDGSPYAVMKHSFGVLGLLPFVVPLWGLTLLGVRSRVSDVPANWPWPLGVGLAFVAQTAVMLVLFLRPSVFDVPRLNAILDDVRQVRLSRGLHGEQVMFSAAGLPPITTYMATIAMLQSPHGPNVLSLMADGRPDRAGDAPHVVTLIGDAYDKPGCREGAPIGRVVVVAGACLEPPSLSFKAGGSGAPYLREGWSQPEQGGVWSNGKRSVVEIPIAPWQRGLKAPRLEAALFAFLPTPDSTRTVIVSVPGAAPQRFVFNRQSAVSHAYAVPLPADALKGQTLTVTIESPDAATPKSLGLSSDTRILGAGLEAMRIVETPAS